MNILSLFDGISCGQLALPDIKYTYYASEINKYAIQVTQKNFPNTIQLGGVETHDKWDIKNIDLIIGGSPCTNISRANCKTADLNGPESRLFWYYIDILEKYSPSHFFLENVVVPERIRDVITKQLGAEPVLIDSALVSAQRRKRYYWTSLPVPQIRDRNINLLSILEYVGPELSSEALAYMMRKVDGKTRFDRFRYHSDTANLKSATVTANWKKGVPNNVLIDRRFNPIRYRHFLPIEAERLQTLPDNYTDCLSKTRRFECIGNGWTVEIIKDFFKTLVHAPVSGVV